jgi:acyl-CoA thioester hydrolase
MHSNFTWNIRVYFEDTDAGGIVFYANYLKFFERARTEWLRAAGVSQQVLSETHGVMFVVKNTALDYHAPAKLDDELKITVDVRRLGRASIQFAQQALRVDGDQETLLVSGDIKVGCIDSRTLRPCPIPDTVSMKLNAE